MNSIQIPVGISNFERIRENNYYYIDKSGLLIDMLKEEMDQVMLITRPRRFGKTLGMSMFSSFVDIRKDSGKLFKGLKIAEHKDICQNWMNKYPTLFLSFKDVDGMNFENAFALLKFGISLFCDEHSYLESSDLVTDTQKKIFHRLREQTATITDVQSSLLILMNMMKRYYGKPVVLLIDEYDVPIAKASSNGYYKEMLEVMKAMLSAALKDNSALKFAVITGCLKIAKEIIFTGTNNFVSDTITDSGLNEYFGFTQEDVDRLLEDAGAVEYAEEIRTWYDGYHFGDFDIYCPWDVLNYLRDLQGNPDARPASYWRNTSDNSIIRSFIDYAGSTITRKLEQLLSGGYIIQHIDENLTYDYLHSSEDNLWSLLYLTGYLTRVRREDLTESLPDGMFALAIPNAEIREIFETTVIRWFRDSALTWNRMDLFQAVWNADSETITREMSKLLRKTISYHDYKEDFYHAFLAGIFAGAGYMTESNREHGEGRSDVIVYDSDNSRVAVFEAKYSTALENMAGDCDKALQQINDRMYAREFEEDYDEVLCYGIAFFKKRCLVRKK